MDAQKDYESENTCYSLVAAGVLGVSATTAATDLGAYARKVWLHINLTVVTDVPSGVVLQDSPDGTTWTTRITVAAADLLATGLDTYEYYPVARYVRFTHVRALANADSYWSVNLVTGLKMIAP